MRTIRTPKNREKFLEGLSEGLSVGAAARSAGFARRTAFEWKAEDPDFAAAWEEAYESGTDAIEEVAIARAKEKSDSLLMFLLKSRRPDKYRERSAHEANKNARVAIMPRTNFD
jgi:Bacteriophage Sf6, terminase small subunit-like